MAFNMVNPRLESAGVKLRDDEMNPFRVHLVYTALNTDTYQQERIILDRDVPDSGALNQEWWDGVWEDVLSDSSTMGQGDGIDTDTPNPVDLPA